MIGSSVYGNFCFYLFIYFYFFFARRIFSDFLERIFLISFVCAAQQREKKENRWKEEGKEEGENKNKKTNKKIVVWVGMQRAEPHTPAADLVL